MSILHDRYQATGYVILLIFFLSTSGGLIGCAAPSRVDLEEKARDAQQNAPNYMVTLTDSAGIGRATLVERDTLASTCHGIDPDRVVAYFPERISVNLAQRHGDLCTWRLRVKRSSNDVIPISDQNLQRGDKIRFAGAHSQNLRLYNAKYFSRRPWPPGEAGPSNTVIAFGETSSGVIEGASGGPVVNEQGELVGIVLSKVLDDIEETTRETVDNYFRATEGQNISGIAIPAEDLKHFGVGLDP